MMLRSFYRGFLVGLTALSVASAQAAEIAAPGTYLPNRPVVLRVGQFAYQIGAPNEFYRTRLVWLVASLRDHPSLPPLPGFIHGATRAEWQSAQNLPVEQRKAYLLAVYKDLATLEISELRASGWKYTMAVLAAIGGTMFTDFTGWGAGELAIVSLNETVQQVAGLLGSGAGAGALEAFGGIDRAQATRYRSDLDALSTLVHGGAGRYASARTSVLGSYFQLVCGSPLPLPGRSYSRPNDPNLDLTLGKTSFNYMTRFGRILGASPGGERESWSLWDFLTGGYLSFGGLRQVRAAVRQDIDFLGRGADRDVLAYLAGLAYDLELVPIDWADRGTSNVTAIVAAAISEMATSGAALAFPGGWPVVSWMASIGSGSFANISAIREEERMAAALLVLRNLVAEALERRAGADCNRLAPPQTAARPVITGAWVNPGQFLIKGTVWNQSGEIELTVTYSGALAEHTTSLMIKDINCRHDDPIFNLGAPDFVAPPTCWEPETRSLAEQGQPGRIVVRGVMRSCLPRAGICEFDLWLEPRWPNKGYESPRFRLNVPAMRG